MKLWGAFLILVMVASCAHKSVQKGAVSNIPIKTFAATVDNKTSLVKGHSPVLVMIKEEEINYAANQTDLTAAQKRSLKNLAAFLLKNSKYFDRVEIVGHADQSGSEDYNLNLSKKRAISVSDILKRAGLSSSQVLTSWRGSSEPIESDQNVADRSQPLQNRRVELKFYGLKKGPNFDKFIEEINSLD